MKYLCLVYGEEKAIQSVSDNHCVAYDAAIRASGHCISSEALEPVATATTVRVRNGKVSVTDGPFAETKEYLAGFYLVEARDLNEAAGKRRQHRSPPHPPNPRRRAGARGEARNRGLARNRGQTVRPRFFLVLLAGSDPDFN